MQPPTAQKKIPQKNTQSNKKKKNNNNNRTKMERIIGFLKILIRVGSKYTSDDENT